ncbi:MAG: hypothetical protein ACHQAX_05500 [Gammaproteobacteria bacterium]
MVTLHAEIIALKEYERRKWWNKTFQPAVNTPSWLNTKLFMTRLALSTWFPLTGIVNFFTKIMTGKHLEQHQADFARAEMERALPAINAELARLNSTFKSDSPPGKEALQKAQAPLLQRKASLINQAIETDLSIETSVCQGGHSRIMPSHGGSLGVSGIKDSVVKAVAPHLEEQMVHLTSQDKLSSQNHHLYKKCGLEKSDRREWVKEEHRNAAVKKKSNQDPIRIYSSVGPVEGYSSSVRNRLRFFESHSYERINDINTSKNHHRSGINP